MIHLFHILSSMFGGHFLIYKLLYLLAFLSPQIEGEEGLSPQESFEVVITTGHQQSAGIIELISFSNQLVDISQDNKLPFVWPSEDIRKKSQSANTLNLLYFNIGNTIELELTCTTIIFPFHCFT